MGHVRGVPHRLSPDGPATLCPSEHVVCTAAPRHCAVLPRQRMLPRTHAWPLPAIHGRSATPLHVNRFGVIPKGHNTGKWRLITDLSYPPGYSVNDGIDPDLCSLSYCTVDHVAAVAAAYSRGALLAKIDIESAYRLIPVHPLDRPLQAWNGTGCYMWIQCSRLVSTRPRRFLMPWPTPWNGAYGDAECSISSITWMILLSLAHPTPLCAQRHWPSWITLAPS